MLYHVLRGRPHLFHFKYELETASQRCLGNNNCALATTASCSNVKKEQYAKFGSRGTALILALGGPDANLMDEGGFIIC